MSIPRSRVYPGPFFPFQSCRGRATTHVPQNKSIAPSEPAAWHNRHHDRPAGRSRLPSKTGVVNLGTHIGPHPGPGYTRGSGMPEKPGILGYAHGPGNCARGPVAFAWVRLKTHHLAHNRTKRLWWVHPGPTTPGAVQNRDVSNCCGTGYANSLNVAAIWKVFLIET